MVPQRSNKQLPGITIIDFLGRGDEIIKKKLIVKRLLKHYTNESRKGGFEYASNRIPGEVI